MIKNKVGRPKLPEDQKVKYRRIPVRVDTAERLHEVKVNVQKRLNVDSITYSQLMDIFIANSEDK